MRDRLGKYLASRAKLSDRPLVAGSLEGVDRVVVIPILAEEAHLEDALRSLAANPDGELSRTLVIGVVNNGPRERCSRTILDGNAECLRLLIQASEDSDFFDGLRVGYVDASLEGCEFGADQGVGLARKIGMDWGVEILRGSLGERGVLCCLDGDCTVDSNYLESIGKFFEAEAAWGGVVDYCHRIEGSSSQQAAIICYELFLRYHCLGLGYANSPYAFHSIGSTMACTAGAYVAVSGMNRRLAGEDFYFLQQLAKTGSIEHIRGTRVYPSSRASWRVPFGTGRRVQRFLEERQDEYRLYSPESYEVIRRWLRLVTESGDSTGKSLLDGAEQIEPELRRYLDAQGFSQAWPRLQQNATDRDALMAQFHRWFDGFRTLKLVHHLRDSVHPDEEMFGAIAVLTDRCELQIECDVTSIAHADIGAQKRLLDELRTASN